MLAAGVGKKQSVRLPCPDVQAAVAWRCARGLEQGPVCSMRLLDDLKVSVGTLPALCALSM